MKAKITDPLMEDLPQLLGGVKDGRKYRLTIESPTGPRTGIVIANVRPPKMTFVPGEITFVLDGETLNENGLYAGHIDKIVSIEEVE